MSINESSFILDELRVSVHLDHFAYFLCLSALEELISSVFKGGNFKFETPNLLISFFGPILEDSFPDSCSFF